MHAVGINKVKDFYIDMQSVSYYMFDGTQLLNKYDCQDYTFLFPL